MTVEEVNAIITGIDRKNSEKWEIMRVQTFHFIQPHLTKKGAKSLTPQKLMPFPWDEKPTTAPAEDKNKILNRLAKAKATGKTAKF